MLGTLKDELDITRRALGRFFNVAEEPYLQETVSLLALERSTSMIPPNSNWIEWPNEIIRQETRFKRVEDVFVEPKSAARISLSLLDAGLFWQALAVPFSSRLKDRNVVDSMLEARFLEQSTALARARHILDIGPGYGRLAMSLAEAAPDATFILCDRFLISLVCCIRSARLMHPGAEIRIGPTLVRPSTGQVRLSFQFVTPTFLANIQPGTIDLVTNVHSMDEMSEEERASYYSELTRIRPSHIYLKNRFRSYSLSPDSHAMEKSWDREIPSGWALQRERRQLSWLPRTLTHSIQRFPVWQRIYQIY